MHNLGRVQVRRTTARAAALLVVVVVREVRVTACPRAQQQVQLLGGNHVLLVVPLALGPRTRLVRQNAQPQREAWVLRVLRLLLVRQRGQVLQLVRGERADLAGHEHRVHNLRLAERLEAVVDHASANLAHVELLHVLAHNDVGLVQQLAQPDQQFLVVAGPACLVMRVHVLHLALVQPLTRRAEHRPIFHKAVESAGFIEQAPVVRLERESFNVCRQNLRAFEKLGHVVPCCRR